MKAFFLSDIHLRDPQESNSQKLLLFLSNLLSDSQATHLFLVGDIFDLWVEDHDFFKSRYKDIISAIELCVKKGIEVHYFEGNHDLYLKKFWQEQIGAKVHAGPEFFDLKPWRLRVEHGDEMNPDDRGYLFLRWFLRTPLMSFVAKNLPGSAVRSIGERASSTSRSYSGKKQQGFEERVRSFTRKHAEKVYRAEYHFDFLIAGHTHVQDDHSFTRDEKVIRSINLGSWYDQARVLVIDESTAMFHNL